MGQVEGLTGKFTISLYGKMPYVVFNTYFLS